MSPNPKTGPSETALPSLNPLVERALGIHSLKALYRQVREMGPENPLDFLEKTIEALGVSYSLPPGAEENIPAEGPLVVVGNHPFGGVDGLILASILLKRRPDLRIMGNYLLGAISEIAELFFFVDVFENGNSAKANIAPLKKTLRWVKDGGALMVFPAGEVSSLKMRLGKVVDRPWTPQVAKIIRMTKAKAVPVYFEGRNRHRFQAAGLVHPLLRTALLPREMLAKKGHRVRVEIGMPVSPRKMAGFETDLDLVNYLRLRTYNLAHCNAGAPAPSPEKSGKAPGKEPSPYFTRSVREKNAREIEAVPARNVLMENDRFRLVVATAGEIPCLLQTIGRYREITFQAVGEGTGRMVDVDVFDNYYKHLILWSKENREPAGAYRIGETDLILKRFGIRGLYTSTLFSIDRAFFKRIGPALEMGRSFIFPDYQRHYAPLLMLWQGIGLFMAQNPRYTSLFGPVSISGDYQDVSRRYMVDFLTRERFLPDLARFVQPRTPPQFKGSQVRTVKNYFGVVKTLDDLNSLLKDIEPENRDAPVLLKQYLKIGGNLLGFNLDYTFGNALDGLILVNLTKTEPKILSRFMGEENAGAYLSHHEKQARRSRHLPPIMKPIRMMRP